MSDVFDRIGSFYGGLVARHGDDPRACDYGTAASQAAKFEALAGVCDPTGLRVLDVGCGLAHFADYLEGRFAGVRYVGIDLSPQMIVVARERRPDLDLRVGNVLDADLDESFDVVTANGIFYLLGPEARELMRVLVERMWSLARRAVAFNSLSAWADRRDEGEFQADPLETLALARTLTHRVTLRHDYLPHDFTVYLYREPPA